MRRINNTLYIEFAELVACGISEFTIKGARRDQSSGWNFIDDPADTRRILVEYEPLKSEYKNLLSLKFGDPCQYLSSTIIQQYLKNDSKDVDFLLGYRLPDNTSIPQPHLNKYLDACKYLHLLAGSSPKDIKDMGFDSVQAFNDAVLRLIRANDVCLPGTYTKLRTKVRQYKEQGAACVISKKFCNDNSRKLSEVQVAFICQLYGKANQLSGERVAYEYNRVAVSRGWAKIAASTVRWHLKKPMIAQQLAGPRKGIAQWRDANDMVVHRSRPSRPNMLWVGDATPYELYYQVETQNKKGHRLVEYWHRKVVYLVIDAFNDAVMGYAIGDTESADLAKLAWKNACVGNGVLPDQVKTDRFASKELSAFYKRVALNEAFYTPSAVGNARDKVVEAMFGRLYNQVTRLHHNAAGRNIKAKEQPNRDYLDKIKHTFPDEAGVIKQIHEDLHAWNNIQREKLGGISLMQQWEQADHTGDRALTQELRLDIFGVQHPHTNRLTNKGLMISIGGETRKYMLADHSFGDTIGTEYRITYDPDNLSSVLAVAVDGRLKYIVPEVAPVPMAFGDMKEGDRKRLNTVLTYKKERLHLTIERNRLQMDMIRAEGLEKGYFTINGSNKEELYEAQNVLKRLDGNAAFGGDEFDGDMPPPVERGKNNGTTKLDVFDED